MDLEEAVSVLRVTESQSGKLMKMANATKRHLQKKLEMRGSRKAR